jgi:hypothetical protein
LCVIKYLVYLLVYKIMCTLDVQNKQNKTWSNLQIFVCNGMNDVFCPTVFSQFLNISMFWKLKLNSLTGCNSECIPLPRQSCVKIWFGGIDWYLDVYLWEFVLNYVC